MNYIIPETSGGVDISAVAAGPSPTAFRIDIDTIYLLLAFKF